MDIIEVITKVDSISTAIGSQDVEMIESAIVDLVDVKECLARVEEHTRRLEDDVENLNARNLALQSANNKLMRTIHAQKDISDESAERMNEATELASMF